MGGTSREKPEWNELIMRTPRLRAREALIECEAELTE